MKDIDTLLAVVVGGMHRPVGVLRSSLYPILDDVDGIHATDIILDTVLSLPSSVDSLTTAPFAVSSIELKTTQIKTEQEDSALMNAFTISYIDLRTTLLKYIDAGDVAGASSFALGAVTLTKVLVKYDEQEQHIANASAFSVTNITLT